MSSELAFSYNYSAVQNKEAQMIRAKYIPREESAMDELKRLDRAVDNAGVIPSLVVGILSCLVFGMGMCFALGALPKSMILGVLLGIIGTVGMLFAYPVHRRCLSRAKETHQARILELAAQLCGETNESIKIKIKKEDINMNKNDQEFLVQKIRTQYTEKSNTRLDELKKLDAKVKRPANVFGYTFGSISAIIMGSGMSLVMTDIGEMIGMNETMVPGIVIGVVGIAMALANYPIYKSILASRKAKYADKIIALSNEMLK